LPKTCSLPASHAPLVSKGKKKRKDRGPRWREEVVWVERKGVGSVGRGGAGGAREKQNGREQHKTGIVTKTTVAVCVWRERERGREGERERMEGNIWREGVNIYREREKGRDGWMEGGRERERERPGYLETGSGSKLAVLM
jgi:hypothetical protein